MRKRGKQPEKKKRRNASPVIAFIGTLLAVLIVGMAGIFVAVRIRNQKLDSDFVMTNTAKAGESTDQASLEEEEKGTELFSLWQKIPEPKPEEVEVTKEKYAELLSDPEYMEANHIYAKENKREGIVSIGFAGDILFDDEYAIMTNLRHGEGIENGISKPLLAQMQEVDIMMVNNEFPYTSRGTRTEGKTYTFRAEPSTVHYLTDMGVDLVSLANNHIFDFGEEGFLDTLDTLKEAQIPYVGAGRDLEEASAPVYFIAGGIKIAIVSATQIERLDNPDTRGATDTLSGVFRCWNPEKMYEAVREAKENSDFTIVYIHWGTENVTEPDWAQLEQAKGLAEAGADLVIGDHPHCLQGIQYYGEVPVLYSLGNFWFNSRTLDTCMIRLDLSASGIEQLTFIPAIQSGCRTDLAYGEEAERIIQYMNSISYGAGIDEDGIIYQK